MLLKHARRLWATSASLMTATERQAEELEKTEDEVSRNLGEILDRSDDVGNKFNVSQHQHDIKNLYIASSRHHA